MSVYISIKESLIKLLKNKYPRFDVIAEEISKTNDDNDEFDIDNYFFLDIFPLLSTTIDQYHTRRNILIDIICCIKGSQNCDYLELSSTLDSIIRPVFYFENRAITIADSSCSIVDGLLHYTFNIDFIDSMEETSNIPYIEELNSKIHERT